MTVSSTFATFSSLGCTSAYFQLLVLIDIRLLTCFRMKYPGHFNPNAIISVSECLDFFFFSPWRQDRHVFKKENRTTIHRMSPRWGTLKATFPSFSCSSDLDSGNNWIWVPGHRTVLWTSTHTRTGGKQMPWRDFTEQLHKMPLKLPVLWSVIMIQCVRRLHHSKHTH